MAYTQCAVCDLCGDHEIIPPWWPGLSRPLSRPKTPDGWITVSTGNGDRDRLYCSLHCATVADTKAKA